MAVSMDDVRAALDPEEPNYEEAAQLGSEALPHLKVLVNSGDSMLASKAAYLASLIEDDRAAEVVEDAARSSDPVVRVAAAAAAANLGAAASSNVLRELARDTDPGVRKVARGRGAAAVAGPTTEREDASVRGSPNPPIVRGLMPGETADGDNVGGLARMPGEMPGGMPGESSMRGGMGEMPGAVRGKKGEMPG